MSDEIDVMNVLFLPLCRWCGRGVVWDAHVSDEWTHWNGPSYCQDSSGHYTASPVHQAAPTRFQPVRGVATR